ncbi:Peroxiredoxin [Aequorivita sublithincola DSM 14238]|uniref:TlpA family protein disulfide reductase n=2 Tax=Aequorivita TaxID=153265 RepID=A0A5C6YKR0_9FLAO|nr:MULTISPECIES: TlpA disulfide reductase family protein [Aequorivita]AFL81763.1 Peroxiredoxin [Aequorivita sublithincola DSM 14238]TXD67815.1 TlpA family protein disulfide reductase [Aequorivita lipolytica]SRX54023.1 Thiol-disulfide oxidoreductase ResA [Aequorivita lipolytica]
MKNILLILFIFTTTFSNAQNSIEEKLTTEIKGINENLNKQNTVLRSEIENLNKFIITITDSLILKEKQNEITELWEMYDNNLVKILQNNLKFAQQNSEHQYSLNLIAMWVSSQAAMNLYDEFLKTYKLFPKEIQNSEKGKKLKLALEKFKNSKVDSKAPLFSLKDINGDIIKLSDFQNNKYVLLDFWASWCGPCREDSPYLDEINRNFKNKGLQIIGISRDENLDSWKKAILKDNMDWINISTVENKSDIENEYFVWGIPHRVLIDKDGVIIGKWKGSGLKNINSIKEKLVDLM